MKHFLASLATANPPLQVTQAEALQAIERLFPLSRAERELYRKVMGSPKIARRFVAMQSTDEAAEDDQDRLIERFRIYATTCACAAAREAMARAGVRAEDIAGIVVTTCTGYLCPGLTSYVAGELRLPHDVRPLDVVGMGCGAALPGLNAAVNMLREDSTRAVLFIAVEICSATFFMGPDAGLVVSNAIFGDGAAACVLTPGARGGPAVSIEDFESLLQPRHRDKLRYRTERHRLRNVLTREVPVLGARACAEVVDRLLARHGLSRSDIAHWIVHPGGSEVLDRVGRKLGLGRGALRYAHEVFHDFGNMSSPSVLFVLDRLMRGDAPPRAGERGLLLSFGAGFTAFATLVEFGAA